MSAFRPENYAEALSLAQSRPQKPRTRLRSSGGIKPRRSAAMPRDTAPKRKRARAKKLSDGKMKIKVWKEFSIFIRTRGADSEGFSDCFTCGVRLHWKQLEAGHLVPGRTNAVLFSEIGINPQCRRCNGHFRGNTIVYYPKMVRLYGQEAVDALIAARDVTHKWQPDELKGLLEHYKALNDANPLVERKARIHPGRTVERP